MRPLTPLVLLVAALTMPIAAHAGIGGGVTSQPSPISVRFNSGPLAVGTNDNTVYTASAGIRICRLTSFILVWSGTSSASGEVRLLDVAAGDLQLHPPTAFGANAGSFRLTPVDLQAAATAGQRRMVRITGAAAGDTYQAHMLFEEYRG